MAWSQAMVKPRGTDGSLLPSLPWTLIALGFVVLPHVPFLPIWITGALLACALWRYSIEVRRRPIPRTLVRAALALTCFLGVLAEYYTISGVGPGSALLAIMAALKLLETRQRRDQFVLLFIAIFLLMSALLREQYLWSLPYLIIGVLLIMTAWLRMAAAESEAIPKSFGTGLRLLMYAAPLALAMWVFFPRIASPFWSVPIDTSMAVSGLGNTMSPGDISSLSQSDAVAFRVDFEGTVPAQRDLYWRGLVLYRFDGRAWTGNKEPSYAAGAQKNVEVVGNPVKYQVTLEPTRQPWVFALDVPYVWTLDQTFMGAQQQLARLKSIDQRVAYDAVSYTRFRIDAQAQDRQLGWYRRLPAGRNPRSVELAQQMHNDARSDEAFIRDVLTMFNNEDYYYTLQPPPLGSNPVDRFLFDTRRGFCEHYASAFAVLMRAAGIPSRVVLGYHGGEPNPVGGYFIVRQADAHAWTEVWLDNVGWQRVDPTAAVAPERVEAGRAAAMFDGSGAAWGLAAPSAVLHQLTLTWDAMNAKWNEWVLGYGPENQDRFMEWLGMHDPSWRKMLFALVGIVIGLTVMISILLMLRYRPPPPDRAARLYARFVAQCGLEPRTGETPTLFADRAMKDSFLPADAVRSITDTYLDARYGPPDPALLTRLESQISGISAR
jgi:transglutaminase-like putative cysteine protease